MALESGGKGLKKEFFWLALSIKRIKNKFLSRYNAIQRPHELDSWAWNRFIDAAIAVQQFFESFLLPILKSFLLTSASQQEIILADFGQSARMI